MRASREFITEVIRTCLAWWLLAVGMATVSPAQPPGRPESVDNAADRQKSSLAAMRESLERQRLSVAKQVGQSSDGGFFVLPPPKGWGTTQAGLRAPECDPLPDSQVESLIAQAAKREGLEDSLLREVMKRESAFRPCAVSVKGAMGLMQLMPGTADQFGVRDPFDPRQNVDAGARLLKQLFQRYNGDLAQTLAAYNAGAARVSAAGGVPEIPETLDYVTKILSALPIN